MAIAVHQPSSSAYSRTITKSSLDRCNIILLIVLHGVAKPPTDPAEEDGLGGLLAERGAPKPRHGLRVWAGGDGRVQPEAVVLLEDAQGELLQGGSLM